MLGDASSNVHMQYLREGVLMTEAEESKIHSNTAIRVRAIRFLERDGLCKHLIDYFLQEETAFPTLATRDNWAESRDNLHDQQTPLKLAPTMATDNDMITKPRHGG